MSSDLDAAAPQSRGAFLQTTVGASLVGAAAALGPGPQRADAIGELYEFKDQARFAQHAVVNVPDMDEALRFYIDGLGMQVLRTRADASTNTTFVGFGPEALRVPPKFRPGVSSFNGYGGHFALELVAPKKGAGGAAEEEEVFFDPGNGLQYIQIAVENYRITKMVQSGGKVLSGYGFVEVVAPGGLKLVAMSGQRRDPFMFVALKVKDMERSIRWYRDILGMKECPYPQVRTPGSPFEPPKPPGAVFMAYDEEAAGVLLTPAARGEAITVGGVYGKLAVLAEGVEEAGRDPGFGAAFVGEAPGIGTRVAVTADPDGYSAVLVEYADFDKELPPLV